MGRWETPRKGDRIESFCSEREWCRGAGCRVQGKACVQKDNLGRAVSIHSSEIAYNVWLGCISTAKTWSAARTRNQVKPRESDVYPLTRDLTFRSDHVSLAQLMFRSAQHCNVSPSRDVDPSPARLRISSVSSPSSTPSSRDPPPQPERGGRGEMASPLDPVDPAI